MSGFHRPGGGWGGDPKTLALRVTLYMSIIIHSGFCSQGERVPSYSPRGEDRTPSRVGVRDISREAVSAADVGGSPCIQARGTHSRGPRVSNTPAPLQKGGGCYDVG